MAKVEIRGINELRRTLKEFPAAVQARVAQVGMRKASSKLRTAMRRAAYAAPLVKGYKRTNKLRQSIRAAVGKRPAYKGKAWVGLKTIPGGGRGSKPLNYYKVLEHGRKPYTSKKRGPVKGSFPMRPFWNRGWATNRAAIERIMVDETLRALAREAGRAYAKSKAGR